MLQLRLLFLTCLLPSMSHAGLLAHWKLDSSPEDEVQDFPAGWEGAAVYSNTVGAPASTAAANFAGTWLNAGTGFDFERTRSFSATAWVKGVPQNSAIVGDMTQGEGFKGWELRVGTNPASVTVLLNNDYPSIAIEMSAAADVLDGGWHQIGFTYDGSSTAAGVKVYVDGLPAPGTALFDTLSGSIANHDEAELEIGTRSHGAAHNFTGGIDEVAIFDHSLAAGEMASIRSAGVESVSFPEIMETAPLAGQSVSTLTFADVRFSFPVSGVDAQDLLVNGSAAADLQIISSKQYRFTFATPPQGDVHFTWAAGHGITGTNGVPAQPAAWSALFVPVLPAGQVVISEFLTKNAGGQEDEDHDSPDWIELYNPGTAEVNLAGWSLTDDPDSPRGWVLPAVNLAPGARKLVFASGKNRATSSGTLHTDFKLSDDAGGYLALTDPSGTIAHVYDGYPKQEGNVSFGLLNEGKPSDGRAGWRYQTPSPGLAQSGLVLSGAAIVSMDSTPFAPVVGNPITVTLRTSPEAVLSTPPVLKYQVMYGTLVNLNFADDGLHGDGAAGDSLWGAIIPGGATAGQMVRWQASLTSNSVVSRWPVNINGANPLPLFEGTVIGGNTAGQALPAYQVFVPNYAFPTSTAQTGIDSDSGARGAFFGNGKLYDNVLIRIKGTTSRYLMKRSHRVDFNPGRDFEWSPDFPAQRELNLNSEYNDPSYLRQYHQLLMHRESGKSGAPHFPVRVFMNGANWQLAFHTYPADSELVETMGLDPRGALYKQVGQLSSVSGEKKSRRWEGSTDLANLVNGISSFSPLANRSLYMYDNLNLPAVINYLAVTRIAQESDDVWANMVVYRDSEGTGEWQPIPFDLNLSFGQLFYGFSAPYNTTIQATNDANKSHPLYGSSACLPNTGNPGQYNRLYNSIIQDPVTRAMLLRRIRTLIDTYLASTPASSPLETSFDTMAALIGPDADIDRTRWGWPPNQMAYGLGPNISPAQGLATLKSDFLAPRRTHFYTTHSINNVSKTLGIGNNNKAGIPDAQVASPVVSFGTVDAHPASGNQNQEFFQLTNPGTVAVDVSGWTVRGSGGSFKMKGGTVIPAAGSIYVSPSVTSFRARTVSPKGNENRFVVGPYSGHLSPYGETLRLENAGGTLVSQFVVPADPNAPVIHLAVTEITSSSAHASSAINGDWWELTNTGTAALELTGFSWDDNHFLAGQAVFPNRIIAAGESIVILNEDDSTSFRSAWNLPTGVQVLTRADFKLADLAGLGSADGIGVFLPDGTEVVRATYTSHSAGKSRAWLRNGTAVTTGFSVEQKSGAVKSNQTPPDVGSPGFAAADPATLTAPYDIWAAANDLWNNPADPSSAPGADADQDGRSNRNEYVFGGNARLSDGPLPQAMLSAGDHLEWTFTRRANDPSILYQIEASGDLLQWSPVTPVLVSETPHPTLGGFVRSTYRIDPAGGAKFLRARAN